MTHAALASKAFGVGAILGGIPMVAVPGAILGLLGVPPADDVWVRLWGMEVVVLGFYYVAAGRADLRPFFVASVWGRIAFCAALIGLVLLVSAPWQVLIVGGFDALGVMWTLAALKRDDDESRHGSTSATSASTAGVPRA